MKLVEVTEDIIRLIFETPHEQAFSMYRIQKFCEIDVDPEIIKANPAKYLAFDPHEIVLGHGLPGAEVKQFFREFTGSKYPLTYEETIIKLKLHKWLKRRKRWYLIVAAMDSTAYHHELSHALYYLDKNYKKEMNQLFLQIPKEYRLTVFKELTDEMEYRRGILRDEAIAYLSTGTLHEIVEMFGKPGDAWNFIETLQVRFLQTLKNYGIG